jgi:hypothetical protein
MSDVLCRCDVQDEFLEWRKEIQGKHDEHRRQTDRGNPSATHEDNAIRGMPRGRDKLKRGSLFLHHPISQCRSMLP